VKLPLEDVPVELPEPVCGINFARDGTPKKVWLSMIAIHSDAWLMSMAFYHAGRVAFDRDDRYASFLLLIMLYLCSCVIQFMLCFATTYYAQGCSAPCYVHFISLYSNAMVLDLSVLGPFTGICHNSIR
jgi:hypothetical protein